MEKEWKRCLIDTDTESLYNEYDYKSWLEDMGKTEEEYCYENYIDDQRDVDMDVFFEAIELHRNGNFLITSTLNVWCDKYIVGGVYSNDLCDTIMDCIYGAMYFKVYETLDGLEVHNMHHDGTNIFYIRPLSENGCKKVDMMSLDEIEWTIDDIEEDAYIEIF